MQDWSFSKLIAIILIVFYTTYLPFEQIRDTPQHKATDLPAYLLFVLWSHSLGHGRGDISEDIVLFLLAEAGSKLQMNRLPVLE